MESRKKRRPLSNQSVNKDDVRNRLIEIRAITLNLSAKIPKVIQCLQKNKKKLTDALNAKLRDRYKELKKNDLEGDEFSEFERLQLLHGIKKPFILSYVGQDEFEVIIKTYENIINAHSIIHTLTNLVNDESYGPEQIINELVDQLNNREQSIVRFFASLLHLAKIYQFYLYKLPDVVKDKKLKFSEEEKNALAEIYLPIKLMFSLNEILKQIIKLRIDSNHLFIDLCSLQKKLSNLIEQAEHYTKNKKDPLQEDQASILEEIVKNIIGKSPEPKSGIPKRINSRSSSNSYDLEKNKDVAVLKQSKQLATNMVFSELKDVLLRLHENMGKVHSILLIHHDVITNALNKNLTDRNNLLRGKKINQKNVLLPNEQDELNRLNKIKKNPSLFLSPDDFYEILNLYSILARKHAMIEAVSQALEKNQDSKKINSEILKKLLTHFNEGSMAEFFYACLQITKIDMYYLYQLTPALNSLNGELKSEDKTFLEHHYFAPLQIMPRIQLLTVSLISATLKDIKDSEQFSLRSARLFLADAFSIIRKIRRFLNNAQDYLCQLENPIEVSKQIETKANIITSINDTDKKHAYHANMKRFLQVNGDDQNDLLFYMYNEVTNDLDFFEVRREIKEIKSIISNIESHVEISSPHQKKIDYMIHPSEEREKEQEKEQEKGKEKNHQQPKPKTMLRPRRLDFNVEEKQDEMPSEKELESAISSQDNLGEKDEEIVNFVYMFKFHVQRIEVFLRIKKYVIPKECEIPPIYEELYKIIIPSNFVHVFNALEDNEYHFKTIRVINQQICQLKHDYGLKEAEFENLARKESMICEELFDDFCKIKHDFKTKLINHIHGHLYPKGLIYIASRPSVESFLEWLDKNYKKNNTKDEEALFKGLIELLEKKSKSKFSNLTESLKSEVHQAIRFYIKLNLIEFKKIFSPYIVNLQKTDNRTDVKLDMPNLKHDLANLFRALLQQELRLDVQRRRELQSRYSFTLFYKNDGVYEKLVMNLAEDLNKYSPARLKKEPVQNKKFSHH